jgi:hypothetical protein
METLTRACKLIAELLYFSFLSLYSLKGTDNGFFKIFPLKHYFHIISKKRICFR